MPLYGQTFHPYSTHASLPITQILSPQFHTISDATVRFFRSGRQNDTPGIVLCLEVDSVKLLCLDAAGNADTSRAIGSNYDPPPGTTPNGTLSDEVDITYTPGDMLGIFDFIIMYKKGTHQDIGGRKEDAAVDFSMEVDIVGNDKEYFIDEDEGNHTVNTC